MREVSTYTGSKQISSNEEGNAHTFIHNHLVSLNARVAENNKKKNVKRLLQYRLKRLILTNTDLKALQLDHSCFFIYFILYRYHILK